MQSTNTGYALRRSEFYQLVREMGRTHATWLAQALGLAAHSRKGRWQFIDPAGNPWPAKHLWAQTQKSGPLQRKVYNLWMSYFR
jgi:hypothetical protein